MNTVASLKTSLMHLGCMIKNNYLIKKGEMKIKHTIKLSTLWQWKTTITILMVAEIHFLMNRQPF